MDGLEELKYMLDLQDTYEEEENLVLKVIRTPLPFTEICARTKLSEIRVMRALKQLVSSDKASKMRKGYVRNG